MKKINKIIIIAFVIIMLLAISTTTFGINIDNIKNNDISIGGEEEIKTISKDILSFVTSLGVAVSVIMLTVLGVKYMMGSAEEKAGYKKSMVPYVVGAVLVFSASAIANIIYQLAK